MSAPSTINAAPLAVPLLHLNGSGYENLTQDLQEAWEALSAAKRALQRMTPHERDYYPQLDHPSTYNRARMEHANRLATVELLVEEIEDLNEALHQQTIRKAVS